MSLSEKELRTISLLSERASHALRTPLSICVGILEEIRSGFPLDAQDITDARGAAERMVETLDFLKQLAAPWGEGEEIGLAQFFDSAGVKIVSRETIVLPVAYGSRLVVRLFAFLGGVARLELESAGKLQVTITSDRKVDWPCDSVDKLLEHDHRLEAFVCLFAESFFFGTGGCFFIGTDDERRLQVRLGFAPPSSHGA